MWNLLLVFGMTLSSSKNIALLKQGRGINLGLDDVPTCRRSSGGAEGQAKSVSSIARGSSTTLADELSASASRTAASRACRNRDHAGNHGRIRAKDVDNTAASAGSNGEDI